MILSNVELQKALDDRRLIINPEPQPRRPSAGGPHCPYDTHSVDLTLGDIISIPEKGAFIYDPTLPKLATTITKNSRQVRLSNDSPYELKPNVFVLGLTRETVELPIRTDTPPLAARIEGKSSRARLGLLVHFTAPTVHPGWRGPLTLEMINLGAASILLRPDMPIAQLIVEEVKGTPFENPSDFRDQLTPPGI